MSFMRPMKAIHPSDLDIVAGQTYSAYITYGIFPDANTRDTELVMGMSKTGDVQEPVDLNIKVALSAVKLVVSALATSLIYYW